MDYSKEHFVILTDWKIQTEKEKEARNRIYQRLYH